MAKRQIEKNTKEAACKKHDRAILNPVSIRQIVANCRRRGMQVELSNPEDPNNLEGFLTLSSVKQKNGELITLTEPASLSLITIRVITFGASGPAEATDILVEYLQPAIKADLKASKNSAKEETKTEDTAEETIKEETAEEPAKEETAEESKKETKAKTNPNLEDSLKELVELMKSCTNKRLNAKICNTNVNAPIPPRIVGTPENGSLIDHRVVSNFYRQLLTELTNRGFAVELRLGSEFEDYKDRLVITHRMGAGGTMVEYPLKPVALSDSILAMKGSVKEIATDLIESFVHNTPEFDTDIVFSEQYLCEHARICVTQDPNKAEIMHKAYIKLPNQKELVYLKDLYYYLAVDVKALVDGTTRDLIVNVPQSVMQELGDKFTNVLHGAFVRGIKDSVCRSAWPVFVEVAYEAGIKLPPAVISRLDYPIYLVTNETGCYGASAIANPEIFRRILREQNSKRIAVIPLDEHMMLVYADNEMFPLTVENLNRALELFGCHYSGGDFFQNAKEYPDYIGSKLTLIDIK